MPKDSNSKKKTNSKNLTAEEKVAKDILGGKDNNTIENPKVSDEGIKEKTETKKTVAKKKSASTAKKTSDGKTTSSKAALDTKDNVTSAKQEKLTEKPKEKEEPKKAAASKKTTKKTEKTEGTEEKAVSKKAATSKKTTKKTTTKKKTTKAEDTEEKNSTKSLKKETETKEEKQEGKGKKKEETKSSSTKKTIKSEKTEDIKETEKDKVGAEKEKEEPKKSAASKKTTKKTTTKKKTTKAEDTEEKNSTKSLKKETEPKGKKQEEVEKKEETKPSSIEKTIKSEKTGDIKETEKEKVGAEKEKEEPKKPAASKKTTKKTATKKKTTKAEATEEKDNIKSKKKETEPKGKKQEEVEKKEETKPSSIEKAIKTEKTGDIKETEKEKVGAEKEKEEPKKPAASKKTTKKTATKKKTIEKKNDPTTKGEPVKTIEGEGIEKNKEDNLTAKIMEDDSKSEKNSILEKDTIRIIRSDIKKQVKKRRPNIKLRVVALVVLGIQCVLSIVMAWALNSLQVFSFAVPVVTISVSVLLAVFLGYIQFKTRYIGLIITLIFSIMLSLVFTLGTIYSKSATSTIEEVAKSNEEIGILGNEELDLRTDLFTILISGIGENQDVDGQPSSDVNILAIVNPSNKEILLIETPKEYFINIPVGEGSEKDKISNSIIYGVESTITATESIYGAKVDFYAKVEISALKDVIDTIGGVSINPEISFNGEEALEFSYNSNVVGIAQEILISAIIEKLDSPLGLVYGREVMNIFEDNVTTNLTEEQIYQLIEYNPENDKKWQVRTRTASGLWSEEFCYSVPDRRITVIEPYGPDIEAIKALVNNMINFGEIE